MGMMDAVSGWTATLGVALALFAVMVIAAVMLSRTTGVITRRFYCPWVRRQVAARFVVADRGEPLSVIECSGLADPSAVTCGRLCVGGVAHPDESRGEAGVAALRGE